MNTTTKDRPTLFPGPMIRALLAGEKNQARGVVKPQPPADGRWEPKEHSERPGYWIGCTPDGKLRNDCGPRLGECEWSCPYGVPGDHLWVRETHLIRGNGETVVYRADFDAVDAAGIGGLYGGWKPSIFMRRAFSRITLEITRIKVERVQEITEADVRSEGIRGPRPLAQYVALWDKINGKRGFGWAVNPWVWRITFRRLEAKP